MVRPRAGIARIRDLSGLLRVSRSASSSLDINTMVREVTQSALGIAGIEGCAIYLWEPALDEVELLSESAIPAWPGVMRPGTRLGLELRPTFREAMDNHQVILVNGDDERLTPFEQKEWLDAGVGSIALIPLTASDVCLGLFCLYARRPNAFHNHSVRLANDLATIVALAIHNASLMQQITRTAAQQAALLDVSYAVVKNNDRQEILEEICRAALRVTGIEGCAIALADPVTDQHTIQHTFVAHARIPEWPERTTRQITTPERADINVLTCVQPYLNLAPNDPRLVTWREQSNADPSVGNVLLIQLQASDTYLGFLELTARHSRPFGQASIRFGQELAAQAAQAIDRSRLHQALSHRADYDGLTGLANHRSTLEYFDTHLTKAIESGSSLSVMMIDLDRFKLLNDTYGHLLGDRVLTGVATLLTGVLGEHAFVGRYGGDEFVVVLPGADSTTARSDADRLLEAVSTATIAIDGLHLPLAMSVGIASYPGDGASRKELIAAADEAMYQAKDAGGSRVRITRQPGNEPTSHESALLGLVMAVDRIDHYTKRQSDLVVEAVLAMASHLRLPSADRAALRTAAMLHDVGKIAIPDTILRKPGYLTPEEITILRQHVTFSALMIQGVPHLDKVIEAVSQHHERWDGVGYPNGLAGEEISLLGRILAIADAYAAMRMDGHHRTGMTVEQIVRELRAGANSQFDPVLVEPFIDAMQLTKVSDLPRPTDIHLLISG